LASKILNENSTAEQQPVINIIRQQVARLSNHIDKVLELGNLESGMAVFTLVRVDFRPALLELCEEFKILVSMEEVEFTYDLKAGEYTIMAEVFHLENAINNLLDNAKKYAKEPKIALKAACEAGNLIIEILDNGPGIDRRDSKRIFQKYFRVQNGDLHDVKGYGLGLSYVMEIIKKLKGNIRIDSEIGKGTKVILSLPLCKTDNNE
jgi:two-component system phosphate regulon sensor histidine kinase PhoR